MNPAAADAISDLLINVADGVARLTLNRPDRRNALSKNLVLRLDRELTSIEADSAIRAVVLAANGPVFCAGHDLSEMAGLTEEEYRTIFSNCSRMMLRLRQLPQPVIARVHGLATAAGCQLVAASDLVVATEQATFATPGVKIGLFCTTPMVPLVRAIAPKAAMEMLITGAPISARRACELGLVNCVVDQRVLDERVAEFVEAVKASSPDILALGKRAFYDELALDETAAYRHATDVITRNAVQPAAQEGITAFLEKRPARWPGGGNQ
ncbi:MAG: enoyl-CoA hydratase [Pirellulales bacterium]|nr:enoyl-CoA hydratase [Pirellulales bacterium]